MEGFGKILRQQRWSERLTIGQLSVMSDVPECIIELSELDCTDVSIVDLSKICDVLGTSLYLLLSQLESPPFQCLAVASKADSHLAPLRAAHERASILVQRTRWRRGLLSRAVRKSIERAKALRLERSKLQERASAIVDLVSYIPFEPPGRRRSD